MKYLAKEMLNGPKDLDSCREIEMRECKDAQEATKFVEEVMKTHDLELRRKRQKKDYDKVILVELFFTKKQKNE